MLSKILLFMSFHVADTQNIQIKCIKDSIDLSKLSNQIAKNGMFNCRKIKPIPNKMPHTAKMITTQKKLSIEIIY